MQQLNYHYKIVWGRGDLFKLFSLIENIPKGSTLLLGPKHYDLGITKLLDLLFPDIHYMPLDLFSKTTSLPNSYIMEAFPNFLRILKETSDLNPEDINREFELDYIFYTKIKRFNNQTMLKMSDELIERITPSFNLKNFIVIHPISIGEDRRYKDWNKIDFTDIDFKVIGSKIDPILIPNKEITVLDFFEVARLLRSCIGLVCVDSCIMNLANALGVPSICIYNSKKNYMRTPNYGYGLVKPNPEYLSCMIDKLFNNELDFSVIPPYCERLIL